MSNVLLTVRDVATILECGEDSVVTFRKDAGSH
jgi:hypothetical protein